MMSCQQVIARVMPGCFPCRVPQWQSLNVLIVVTVIILLYIAFIHYIQYTSVQCLHFSLAGESLSGDNPTLPEIQEFLSGFQEPVMFDKVFTKIVESLKVAGEWGVANELQERGATKSNPIHLFGVWLATAAATTRPATWADFVQLLRKAGVDEGVVQTVPGGPWDSHQSDMFHVSVGQQPPVTAKAVQELSTKQVDQPRGVCSSSVTFTQSNLLCVHTVLC